MFTKLRNRFLLLNLVSISVMMLVAFATIYTITYRDTHNTITRELQRLGEAYQKPPTEMNGGRRSGLNEGDWQGGTGQADTAGEAGSTNGTGATSSAGNANAASTDAANSAPGPIPIDKPWPDRKGVDAPPERSVNFQVLTDANRAFTSAASMFDLDQDFYQAALQEAVSSGGKTGQFTLDGTRWAYDVQPTKGGYQYVFLDVTAQQQIVTKLVYTFSAVGLVMLLVIYGISRFFANRSIEPIREAFNKQKQFIADASHELKTPLSIISTNADVLLTNESDTIRQQAKWLHYIKSETERMSRLTNDLLYLTELDDSRTGVVHAPFNLSEAVESIILTMEAVIFEKALSLDYTIEPGLTVTGSSEQIKQVILILLDNAIKYTNPNGTVSVTLARQGHGALLSVTNTGDGIAPEHLSRIFDRFYRTDASRNRKQGGYGLGLAIAKSLVEQHKGKISAKSIVGESTTFTVQLG
ncbi:HAMP domain-containing sensor histidine kinase [Gorillibacterium sp. CAU 1737]|uniref:sensor histidine kinase n=1 Tax=Gorillibacterium sp. CAU 1737 TaxID=3140362 RepID=UPI0032603B76